ncbi:MAG: hypothetical protein E7508_01900 [Ruminococcus sp.]|nr:hypothetical protein [Ruminococcus sp.]
MCGKMGKAGALLMAALMVMSLSACSEEKPESKAEKEIVTETVAVTEAKETETEAETEEETKSEYTEETEPEKEAQADNGELEVTYTGPTKEIGDEKFGYMQVPENWCIFEDIGVDDSTPLCQYCSPDRASIVTMSYFEGMDAELVANAYYQGYSEDAVEELTAATVMLDGKTAYQVYGYFTDINKIMVTWVIDGEDGLAHSLSIESQDYDVFSLSGTYTLNK